MNNSTKLFLFLLISLFTSNGALQAQVIWQENFNYPNTTAVGANNNTANPAVDWTSTCPTCTAGNQWFYVRGNLMEGRNVDGPATLTTELIDISAYPAGVEVSIDMFEQGDMEGCPTNGIGCNSVDWIRVEYSINGGPYADWSSPVGGPCAATCAGNTYVTLDDFNSYYFKECPVIGNSIQLRVSMQNWASSEYLRVDNIVISAQNCQNVVAFDSLVHNDCFGGTNGEIWIQSYSNLPPYVQPYTLSLNGGPFVATNNFTGLAAGTYTVVVEDSVGNRDTLNNLVITEPAALSLADSSVGLSCNGLADGEIHAINVTGGTPPYAFSLNGGPAQSSPGFTGLGPGTYSLVVIDSLGCMDSITGIVLVDPPVLSVTVTTTPTACSPFNGTATALASGGTPSYTYLWNTTPPQTSATASGLQGGNYIVTVTDTNGCTAMDSGVVTQPPTPTVLAGPGDTICVGQGGTQLSATGTGGNGTLSYTWTCNTTSSPCNLGSPNAATTNADPIASTWYYVQVTDTNNCSSLLDSALVWVEDFPIAYAGEDTVLCEGDELELIPEVFGNPLVAYTFEWRKDGNLLNPSQQDTLSIIPSETGFYSLTAVPDIGCSSLPDTILVEVEDPFEHPAPEDLEYCPGEPLWIGVDSLDGYSYAWTPVTGLVTPSRSITELTPNENLSLMLTITSENLVSANCKVQEFPILVTLGDCELPNVVTPNGDGFNDVLDLGPYFNDVEIHIYDRWGKLIYANSSYQHDWDGTNGNGEPLSEGVYFYTVEGDWIGTGNPNADVTQYSKGRHLTLLR